ncbi:hypothetical protein LSAT2_002249, partial [Lamellibrachia satsuma]
VLDTSKNCIKELKKSLLGALDEIVKDGYDKLRQSLEPKQLTASVQDDMPSQCIAYANAGDCRFYSCFHVRFPCDVFGASHMADFELQLCIDLDLQSEYFDSEVTIITASGRRN